MDLNFDIQVLDKIIKDTIDAVKNNQKQMFDLTEAAYLEYHRVKKELKHLQVEITRVINRVDNLEREYKKARQQLITLSRNFKSFSEEEIKTIYELAQSKQFELLSMQEKEKNLRLRRTDLEVTLTSLKKYIQKAEKFISNIKVFINLLMQSMKDLSGKVDEVKEVQEMGLNIIKAQEEERKQVSREIHDGPAQSIANTAMQTDICIKLLDMKNMTELKSELLALQELARRSLSDTRKIIYDLRPMMLDELGLIATVKYYVAEFKTQTGIPVGFQFIGKKRRFDSTMEAAIFRVIQEALNNVRKHAGAHHVDIKMELFGDRLNILIKDDGVGFNVKETIKNRDRENYGLVNMRERVKLIKGDFNISSTNQGTKIIIKVPLL